MSTLASSSTDDGNANDWKGSGMDHSSYPFGSSSTSVSWNGVIDTCCPPSGPRGGFSTVSGKKCFRLIRSVASLGLSIARTLSLVCLPGLFRLDLDAIRRLAPLTAICAARPAPDANPRFAKSAMLVLAVTPDDLLSAFNSEASLGLLI